MFTLSLSSSDWFAQGFRRGNPAPRVREWAEDFDKHGRSAQSSTCGFEFWCSDSSVYLLNRLGWRLFRDRPPLLSFPIVAFTAGRRYRQSVHPQSYAHELYEFVERWEDQMRDVLADARIEFPPRWLPYFLEAALPLVPPSEHLENLLPLDACVFETGPGCRAETFRRLRSLHIHCYEDIALAARNRRNELQDWDDCQRALDRDR